MKTPLVLVLLMACGSEPPSKPKEAACAGVPAFATWLTDLDADGYSTIHPPKNVKLVTLEGTHGHAIPLLPSVMMTGSNVSFDGQSVGRPDDPEKLARDLADRLRELPPKPDPKVMFVIDGDAPWGLVGPVMREAALAGFQHQTFLFVAGKPRAAHPGWSSFDAELDAAVADGPDPKARSLAPKPRTKPGIFDSCASASAFLASLGTREGDGKLEALVAGMPRAIAQCGCKLEINAVERYLWSMYDRDRGGPHVAITVTVAAGGKPIVDRPQTPWSQASLALRTAAATGATIEID